MLHSWVQHRLSLYLGMLKRYLPLITEGSNLASMLEHCMVGEGCLFESNVLMMMIRSVQALSLPCLCPHPLQLSCTHALLSSHTLQYCGSSLSRVGLDFQGLLQPLFETCSLALLAQHFANAVEVFNTRCVVCLTRGVWCVCVCVGV